MHTRYPLDVLQGMRCGDARALPFGLAAGDAVRDAHALPVGLAAGDAVRGRTCATRWTCCRGLRCGDARALPVGRAAGDAVRDAHALPVDLVVCGRVVEMGSPVRSEWCVKIEKTLFLIAGCLSVVDSNY